MRNPPFSDRKSLTENVWQPRYRQYPPPLCVLRSVTDAVFKYSVRKRASQRVLRDLTILRKRYSLDSVLIDEMRIRSRIPKFVDCVAIRSRCRNYRLISLTSFTPIGVSLFIIYNCLGNASVSTISILARHEGCWKIHFLPFSLPLWSQARKKSRFVIYFAHCICRLEICITIRFVARIRELWDHACVSNVYCCYCCCFFDIGIDNIIICKTAAHGNRFAVSVCVPTSRRSRVFHIFQRGAEHAFAFINNRFHLHEVYVQRNLTRCILCIRMYMSYAHSTYIDSFLFYTHTRQYLSNFE